MNELINRLLAGNLKELSGLEVRASIPVPDDLVNGAIADLLAQAKPADVGSDAAGPAKAVAPAESPKAARPKLDPKALLIHVKSASIRTENGKMTLAVHVRVD